MNQTLAMAYAWYAEAILQNADLRADPAAAATARAFYVLAGLYDRYARQGSNLRVPPQAEAAWGRAVRRLPESDEFTRPTAEELEGNFRRLDAADASVLKTAFQIPGKVSLREKGTLFRAGQDLILNGDLAWQAVGELLLTLVALSGIVYGRFRNRQTDAAAAFIHDYVTNVLPSLDESRGGLFESVNARYVRVIKMAEAIRDNYIAHRAGVGYSQTLRELALDRLEDDELVEV